MTSPLSDDLNQTIVNAINARVEAEVLEAMSGDETIGKMVVAALQQPVVVPSSKDSYRKVKVPFLHSLIRQAIQNAAKRAVERLLVEQEAEIERELRAHLHTIVPQLAQALAMQLAEKAKSTYGINVSLRFPGD